MDIHQLVDQQYAQLIEENDSVDDRWLLMQNLALGKVRRNLIETLQIESGEKVLDLGCGFGALSLDVVTRTPAQVTAVDVDSDKLKTAKAVTTSVCQTAGAIPGSVSFYEDDAYGLSFKDDTFDWVISQHVFQHLEDPSSALCEVFRVTKPGGRVCLIDVDDGLGVSYPPQDAFVRLSDLMAQVQADNGGDRYVGRKLAYLVHAAGFDVTAAVPLVQTGFLSAEEKSLMLKVVAEHIAHFKEAAIAKGLVSSAEFDALLKNFVHNPLPYTFEMDTRLVVVGQKPQ